MEAILGSLAQEDQGSIFERLNLKNAVTDHIDVAFYHIEELVVALAMQTDIVKEAIRHLQTVLALLKRTIIGLPSREGSVHKDEHS